MRRILLTISLILGSVISYSQTSSDIYNDEWRQSLEEKINFITFKKQCDNNIQFRVYRGDSDIYNISIANSSGKEIYHTSLKKEDQFDISNFYPGTYFITADDGVGNCITKQIIIGG